MSRFQEAKWKVLKHRVILTFLIIIVAILATFLLSLYFIKIKEENISKISCIYYSAGIVAALYAVIGTVIAVWQYYITSSHNTDIKVKDEIKQAIDLSGYYKDNVLVPFYVIKFIYKKCDILSIVLSVDREKMKQFNEEELSRVYNKKTIDHIDGILGSNTFTEAVLEANDVFGLNLCCYDGYESTGKRQVIREINNVAKSFLETQIVKTLNNAEYFSMYFTHQIADNSVIYQSIYPSYIEMCQVLYYYIAKCSDNTKERLYSNLVGLYNIWIEKSKKQKEEIAKQEVNIGTVAPPNYSTH